MGEEVIIGAVARQSAGHSPEAEALYERALLRAQELKSRMIDDAEQRRIDAFWAEIDADDDPAYQAVPDEEIYG